MYVKLFSSILHSSIWSAPSDTRLVWITLLAMSDQDGFVRAAPSGLARAANIPFESCLAALAMLEAPDTESGTQEYDGRRVEAVPGGWVLLNYAKYRNMRDVDVVREQTRERVRRHREKKRNVTLRNPSQRQAEAEAEAETDTKAGSGVGGGSRHAVTRRSHPVTPTSAAAAAIPRYTETRQRLPEDSHQAFDGLVRSSQSPTALVGEIAALLDGMHGPVATPEAMGLALRDLVLAGGRVTGNGLRAFVRSATLTKQNGGTSTDPWAAAAAKAAEEERRASGKD